MKPTIVLVHGAFVESSSWDGGIDPLVDAGHPVSHPQAVAHQIMEAAAVNAVA